ncbi:MAG: LPXTG cell wall anchor domain-containing protein [Propionibacteriales bacterium]|nr:LPXTG cell wall anchor domain-containing protein [Propionibacteriales bacterium]
MSGNDPNIGSLAITMGGLAMASAGAVSLLRRRHRNDA